MRYFTHAFSVASSIKFEVRFIERFIKIWASLTLSRACFYLLDWILPSYQSRFYSLQFNYLILFLIIYIYLNQIKVDTVRLIEHKYRVFFVITTVVNLILAFKLFSNNYLLNTLDFQPHVNLINYIRVEGQPLLGTTLNGSDGAFYPMGSLYFFASLSNLFNINVLIFLKYGYILTCALFWPLVLWNYLKSFNISELSRCKIFIVALTLNQMPFGYFYWGHWPTVQSILLAIFFEGSIFKNYKKMNFRNGVFIFCFLLIITAVHPVGLGTFFVLILIRKLFTFQFEIRSFISPKPINQIIAYVAVTLILLVTVLFNKNIFIQVNENWMKLINGTTFIYKETLFERFVLFFYEWIINLKYTNNLIFDFLYFFLLILIVFFLCTIREKVILLTSVALVLSTAFAQQPFPYSLIAVPTFLFYSSPSRISHILIIVITLILGAAFDRFRSSNRLMQFMYSVEMLTVYFIISNVLFYIKL